MSCQDFDLNVFLQNFPQFGDVNIYPPEIINFWVGYGSNFFNKTRWGTLYPYGFQLLLAHNLLVSKDNGQVNGIINNKSVDSVSAGYELNALLIEDAGFYNKTVYGIQYIQLAQQIGAGADVVLNPYNSAGIVGFAPLDILYNPI